MSETTNPIPAKTRTRHACACLTGTSGQCSETTLKQFAQGHDARMSSRVATAIAEGKMSEADGLALIRQAGGGELLISKTRHSAKLRATRGTGPKAPKKAKAEAKPEPKAPSMVGKTTKVFHGKRNFNATVVKNAADQLVARHRLNSQNCDHEVSVEDGEIFTK